MELLTSKLPTATVGHPMSSVVVNPDNFVGILNYEENYPANKVDQLLHDIRWISADEPYMEKLYITDLDYVIFLKKALTVSKDLELSTTYSCPECGIDNSLKFKLSQVTFNPIPEEVSKGAVVVLNGHTYNLRIPTIAQFIPILHKYVTYKKLTDLDLIKLISLFEEFALYPNQVEDDILYAKHEDIKLLALIEEVYLNRIKPIQTQCSNESCPTKTHSDDRRHLKIRVDSLISNFLSEVIENNAINSAKIKFK